MSAALRRPTNYSGATGAVTTASTQVTLKKTGSMLQIQNTDGANDMQFSFSGTTWYTLPHGQERIVRDIYFQHFFVRPSSSNAVNWEAIVNEG